MASVESDVFRFAVSSRVVIFLLQVFFNWAIPDHDADAFKMPGNKVQFPLDETVLFLFGGFGRWDAQHFMHIACYGYTYEHSLAFFPLYPLALYYSSFFLNVFFSESLSFYSLMLISGTMLNALFFTIAAVLMYHVSCTVLCDRKAALLAALFFCVNPASVFCSACYSESLFALLTYGGMLCTEKRKLLLACCLFGLSSATRSNGIVSVGFVLYVQLKLLVNSLLFSKISIWDQMRIIIVWAFKTALMTVICLLPFIAYQVYACLLYCVPYSVHLNWPPEVTEYGQVQGFHMPGKHLAKWCKLTIPLSYTFVQKNYWNVGLLQYYAVRKIPNIILALPVIMLIINATWKYYKRNYKYCLSLGFGSQKFKKQDCLFDNKQCFVYIVHATVLAVICILWINIEVTTRLIAATSPVLYWIAASIVLNGSGAEGPDGSVVWHPTSGSNVSRPANARRPAPLLACFGLLGWSGNMKSKAVVWYFWVYCLVGTALHANFLPWT